jgi:secondary thiamine-phosphate synthase enzyme
MAVHAGLLRLATEGNGHILDITPGVASVVQQSGAREAVATVFGVGSTVAVTTMEFEPGGVRDLSEALERLIPTHGDYEHNRLNHDTNSHAHMRAALIGTSEANPGRRRYPGTGHLAAGRAAGLRRPPAAADGARARRLLNDPRTASRERYTRRSRFVPGQMACAKACPRRESPAGRGAAVFENSTACASRPTLGQWCVQVRPSGRCFGTAGGQNYPSCSDVPLCTGHPVRHDALCSRGVHASRFFTESLILAQDERWRRA